jgi:hypothetical protein
LNDGTVIAGPPINTTYPLGSCLDDYEFIAHPSEPDYLDAHNGRFCTTPEYPNGTYAYFTTVNAQHNSIYPYIIGPTYYGIDNMTKVTSVSETNTTYSPTATRNIDLKNTKVSVFPNPASSFIAVQVNDLVQEDLKINLVDMKGYIIDTKVLAKGSTMVFFDVSSIYAGSYVVKVMIGSQSVGYPVQVIAQ